MNVAKKDLPKSQVELIVELSFDELKPFIERGAENISREVKIDGFRPGKVPLDVLKRKIGEMSILEEAARIAINKTIDKAIKDNAAGEPIGQPEVSITKLSPDNPMEYKVIFAILPKIELGDCKAAKVKKRDVEVTGEEVVKVLDQLREAQAKEAISEAEIKEGDKVAADIEMFLDNVPVEGGQGKGVAIIIGKNYIIPGFDKHLVGAKKGDVREFKLKYPSEHHMANLAGQMVDFKVKILEVYSRELPEINEEFAKNFGLKNGEELKANIKKSLEEEKKQKEEQKTEVEIIENILGKTRFGDIPDMLVNHEAEAMMHDLEHKVSHEGGKFEDYLQSMKKTREQLMLDILPDAVKRVKSALLIREIAIQEKITVSEEEINQRVEDLLKQYKGYQKVEDRVKSHEYRHYLKNTIANKKVMDKLKEWNVEK